MVDIWTHLFLTYLSSDSLQFFFCHGPLGHTQRFSFTQLLQESDLISWNDQICNMLYVHTTTCCSKSDKMLYIKNQKETTGLIQDGSFDRIIVGQQRALRCYSLFSDLPLDLTSFRATADTDWHNMVYFFCKHFCTSFVIDGFLIYFNLHCISCFVILNKKRGLPQFLSS